MAMVAKLHKLRINCTPAVHAQICAYRFQGHHETRSAAVIALIVAGLAAVAKPTESPKPNGPKKLVAYAGKDRTEHRPAEWVARP